MVSMTRPYKKTAQNKSSYSLLATGCHLTGPIVLRPKVSQDLLFDLWITTFPYT